MERKEFSLSPEHVRSYHLPVKEKKAGGAMGPGTGMALALPSDLTFDIGDRGVLDRTAHLHW